MKCPTAFRSISSWTAFTREVSSKQPDPRTRPPDTARKLDLPDVFRRADSFSSHHAPAASFWRWRRPTGFNEHFSALIKRPLIIQQLLRFGCGLPVSGVNRIAHFFMSDLKYCLPPCIVLAERIDHVCFKVALDPVILRAGIRLICLSGRSPPIVDRVFHLRTFENPSLIGNSTNNGKLTCQASA
jgi:hypothetical protein